MVKDAFSENGSGLPPAADGLIPQTQSESAQAPAANLTELAQLLAASIAQSQAGKGRTGIPTNADLTSLANLVSAAQGQRTLAPVFKDGLSSLSYSQARPAQGAAQAPLDIGHHHDDEPMPIPSTWRQPMAHDEERWLRQQMGAAVRGPAGRPRHRRADGAVAQRRVRLRQGQGRRVGPDVVAARRHGYARCQGCGRRLRESTVKVQVRPVEKSEPAPPVRGAVCDRQRRCKAARAGARSRAAAGYSPAADACGAARCCRVGGDGHDRGAPGRAQARASRSC